MDKVTRNPRTPRIAALTALLLAACSGGSDDTGTGDSTGTGGTTAPPGTTAASLTLTGTAAVGAAITGRPVTVKCSVGSGIATTGSDGTYTVTVPAGAWPCAAQVTSASGVVLTTVATAGGASGTSGTSGTSAIANLTPASQLVVAALVAGDPAAWFQAYTATSAAAVTAAAVGAAQAQVVATLKAAGVDFTAVGDLLAAAYTTAYDNLLLTFGQRLTASGLTLASLTATVATVAATPSAVSVASDLLLQPASASCSALRTATYRLLTPAGSGTLSAQTSLLTVDATMLQVGHASGTTGTWVANGSCRYGEQAGSYAADITVTQAGVLVGRYTNDGTTYRAFVGFPEQLHSLAELAGNWNVIGMSRVAAGVYAPSAGVLTYDANGALTAATSCQNTSTWAIDSCTTVAGSILAGVVPFVADSAGGFDVTDPNTRTVTGRLFAFKAGSGDLMLANVDANGELFLSAPVKAATLPTVGQSSSNWNLDSTGSLLAPSAIYAGSVAVTSVDSGGGSYTRTQTPAGSSVSRPETLFVNVPRTGYVRRPSATVTDSSGAAVTLNAFDAQSMPGMGFSPLVLTSASGTRLFELSARQP